MMARALLPALADDFTLIALPLMLIRRFPLHERGVAAMRRARRARECQRALKSVRYAPRSGYERGYRTY